MGNVITILNESLSFFNMWGVVTTIIPILSTLTIFYFGLWLLRRASMDFYRGKFGGFPY